MPSQNVELVAPQAPTALICDSPHSGTLYPADFGHACSDIETAMRSEPWPGEVQASARCIELGNRLVFSKTTTLAAIYDRRLAVAAAPISEEASPAR